MTRYEIGFMSKCAEYGLDTGTAIELLEKRSIDLGTAKYIARRLKASKNPAGLAERLMGMLQMRTGGKAFGFVEPDVQRRVLHRIRGLNPGMKQYLSGMEGFRRDLASIGTHPDSRRTEEYTKLLADLIDGGPLRHADSILEASDVGDAMSRVSRGAPSKFGKREVEIAKNLRDALAAGSV